MLDDIFRRVLDDGERMRAEREPGESPPWTPEPQTDPLYEGLEPEDWDKVASPPEILATEWRDAVLLNRVNDVEPLVEDALEARGLEALRTGTAWRRFMRLALLAATEAHGAKGLGGRERELVGRVRRSVAAPPIRATCRRHGRRGRRRP